MSVGINLVLVWGATGLGIQALILRSVWLGGMVARMTEGGVLDDGCEGAFLGIFGLWFWNNCVE